MTAPAPAPLPAPGGAVDFDEVLLLVGRLNYAWTNTESLLIHFIAGLAGTDKETATVIFLTLNTTRARVSLVERLAKMKGRDAAERAGVLDLTGRIMRLSALRNRYNHSIYAFDSEGGNPRTILMRISDRRDDIRMGQSCAIDTAAVSDIRAAAKALHELNVQIWRHIGTYGYPA